MGLCESKAYDAATLPLAKTDARYCSSGTAGRRRVFPAHAEARGRIFRASRDFSAHAVACTRPIRWVMGILMGENGEVLKGAPG